MPLIKSNSKAAFSKNVSAEMHAGKPQNQALAVAYNTQRTSGKRTKKMAEGGNTDSDADLKEMVLKHMEEVDPPIEEGRWGDYQMYNKGGKTDMFTKKKKYAYGGAAEDTGEPSVPTRKPDDYRLPEDDYMSDQFTKGGPAPAPKPDNMRPSENEYMGGRSGGAYADGGEVEDHYSSIADAILAKKRKAKKMAEGGQVDLSENATEDRNNEDQMSYEAAGKENYSESSGLSALSSPMDSAQQGDSREEDSENEEDADMVSSIRKRMKSRRGY